jgi:hypothetical protein
VSIAETSARTHTKVVYGRVAPELHDMARRCAQIEDRTMSSLVRQALLLYFQHQGYLEVAEEAEKIETETKGDTWPEWMQTQR